VSNQPIPTRSATPWNAVFSLFMALLYGVSPIDLIPDVIPLVGWLDDAAVVPVFLALAFFQYRRAKKRAGKDVENRIIVMPTQK